jgi:hypothetical protein
MRWCVRERRHCSSQTSSSLTRRGRDSLWLRRDRGVDRRGADTAPRGNYCHRRRDATIRPPILWLVGRHRTVRRTYPTWLHRHRTRDLSYRPIDLTACDLRATDVCVCVCVCVPGQLDLPVSDTQSFLSFQLRLVANSRRDKEALHARVSPNRHSVTRRPAPPRPFTAVIRPRSALIGLMITYVEQALCRHTLRPGAHASTHYSAPQVPTRPHTSQHTPENWDHSTHCGKSHCFHL